ncbi:ComF family protein [Microbulbifer magnicolonia]|uniref:ComF family protein n=1 Tax=Microbulbifer magnicolonia TaxID=3109744 RepID=UPI002B408EEA|nr:ComF family protein [Microbulbifer sp. GG15]
MVYRPITQFLSGAVVPRLARCLLCGESAGDSGLCAACCAGLPFLHGACARCALPLAGAAGSCAHCLQHPPSFASASAAWHYAFPIGQLVQRFKYHRDLTAGHSLARLAALHIEPQAERPDLLVPVPLHWRRYWRRGYNQAQLIAAEFAHQWQIPVANRLLRKRRASETQQQLKRAQRLRNLQRSFAVHGTVDGLHIGLVDDVITTGATLEAAARALLDAGARRISAFALARTP